jgi:hypothetical protein
MIERFAAVPVNGTRTNAATVGWGRRVAGAAFLALALAGPAAAQAQKSYVREDLALTARSVEDRLRSERQSGTATALRREGEALLKRNEPREALPYLASAAAAEPMNAGHWLAYARAAMSFSHDTPAEKATLPERAIVAAYLAYQRAAGRAEEAEALTVLAETYASQGQFGRALKAYRTALRINETPRLRASYDDLQARQGFKPKDYTVESETMSPRACFQFPEALPATKVDFSPYVVVSGVASPAITAEGSQLCVEGLKHGDRYSIVLRPGLPAASGDELVASADYDIYVRDRSPAVRFTGRNYVLPRTGQEGIPVVSVNTGEIGVDIHRIGDRNLLGTLRSEDFLSQLSRYSTQEITDEKGFKIWSGTLEAKQELNRDVTTAFPVLDAVGRLEPGVYVMTAWPKGTPSDDSDWQPKATQWFVVSDFGLTAFKGGDGVHVFLRSLSSARPLADVEVRLVARNNEVLATKRTDPQGHIAFDPGLARGEGGMAPALIVASAGTDYGFLDLGGSAFDLTDRGVKGREAAGPMEAFVYPERGVYRTGETVQVTALLRDAKGVAVPGLPLTLVVERPDGVEYRRAQVEDQGLGGRAFPIPVLAGAQRGTWRVTAYTDPKGAALGEASFLVEDYVPERLEVELTAKSPALRPGDAAQIDVNARYLFGAPGSDLQVGGNVVVKAAERSAVKGLEAYTVGLQDEEFESTTVEIEEPGTTDAAGRVTMTIPVQDATAPRPLETQFLLNVAESGGRAVERSITLPILPSGPVVGVRKTFGELTEGATATFEVVLAQADGTRLARKDVPWTLSRIETRYQWYNQDGRWGYEPVKTVRRVADGRIDLTTADPARIAAPVQWGNYRLDVKAEALGPTAQTSVGFTVGWSGEATADVPDLLDMRLDKASYGAGETLQARLAPRFAGQATLAVVSDRVHDIRVVDVPASGITVSVPVKAEWGAGAYLVAMAHRPLDIEAKRQPGRALGLAWFEVDRDKRKLEVSLQAPAQMRPRGPLAIPVRVAGLQPGEEARITVAAVDLGILNLTRYKTPDPGEHFFGQKQLSTEIRDLYGYLIDGMQGTRGAIRSGGDEGAVMEGAPPTQEPLARYSGVVRVGPDGTAEVTFDIPAFNGTARVMAVAWTRDRVGHATQDVIIRDPIVVAGTLPRFLSVGDQSRIHLQIDNVEGAAGDYTVDLDIRGPVVAAADALRRKVSLKAGGKASVSLPIAAAGPGLAQIGVTIRGPGIEAAQNLALRVQPGTSSLVNRTVRTLEPGGSLNVSQELLADILPGTGAVSVAVSPLSALDVPSLLQALDRYPYGCTEQTVSRALPLLYVNTLAAREALALDDAVDQRVREAIERVLSRQGSDGSFGLWSAGGDDLWLDAYTVDFLTRARERNFTVPQPALSLALDQLRNAVANNTDVAKNGEAIAYAAYVLARNGRPVMGDLRYLADTQLSSVKTAMARAQIAAALALLGDRGRSQTAFASAAERLRETRDTNVSRSDYGSRLRDGAALLTLAFEAGTGAQTLPAVGRVIEEERRARTYTSTQDNAWMVLAAQAAAREAETVTLTVNGTPRRGAFLRTFREAALKEPTVIANTGTAPVQMVVGVAGNPLGFEPAVSRGFTVERAYYKLDGTKVDLAQVRQNERFVTVLSVTETAPRASARLLLVDRLPAGLEIDNPNLVDSGAVGALDWLTMEVEPTHAEYRDDRFVAAFDRESDAPKGTFTVAYMVRAVAPGRYVHPPAMIEDMYAPDRFGRTAFGSVEVVPASN